MRRSRRRRRRGARSGPADQRAQELVQPEVLVVEVLGPPAELTQRDERGVVDDVSVIVWPEFSRLVQQRRRGARHEPGPDWLGGAQDQVTDLVQDFDAFIDCGSAGDHQHPDRFDVAVTMLRLAGCGSAQRGSSRCDGVDGVGLAVAAPGLTVGSIDLDHSDAFAAQVSGEPVP